MSFGALDDSGVAAFLFGKLPAHGDFISRGLDDDAIEAADAAVAEAVTIAALHWDHRWDDVYVETPVWRFLAAPGVIGREWTAGIFMASVDAVGRQFPLVAGFSAPNLALIARSDVLTAALDEAEALARTALIEGHSVDTALAAFERAARRFDPQSCADPGEAFAAAALARAQSASWSAEGLFWVAGATTLDPVPVSGALGGEALAKLFQPLPLAPAAPMEAPQAEAEAEAGADAGAGMGGAADSGDSEDSPPGEAVISSPPPADETPGPAEA